MPLEYFQHWKKSGFRPGSPVVAQGCAAGRTFEKAGKPVPAGGYLPAVPGAVFPLDPRLVVREQTGHGTPALMRALEYVVLTAQARYRSCWSGPASQHGLLKRFPRRVRYPRALAFRAIRDRSWPSW